MVRSGIQKLLPVALVLSLACFGIACNGTYDSPLANQVHAVSSEVSVSGPTVAEIQSQRINLQTELMAERIEIDDQAAVRVEMSLDELHQIATEEMRQRSIFPGPKLIGVIYPVAASVNFRPLRSVALSAQPRLLPVGAVRLARDGGFVWSTSVSSSGAKAIRLHLAGMSLPESAELFIFGSGSDAFGPYTAKGPAGSGEFWAPSIIGSVAHVLVRYHGAPVDADLAADWFTIDSIGHVEPAALDLNGPDAAEKYGIGTQCYGASCTENASGHYSQLNGAADGIAEIQFIEGPYVYMCTGGLLADSDTSSQIPYFLTAHHCISRGKVAKTMEAYFRYQSSGTCGDADQDGLKVGGGAALLKSASGGDYTLLRLNSQPPAGSVFLGWSTADIAYADGTSLFRFSHPAGGPLAYSEHSVDVGKGTCQSWPRGGWIYSTDTFGATEGGSSGSPVLNSAGQVVGQLSGGCGTNVNDECDTVNNATVDGAFARYYADIAQWLGSGSSGGCADADGDGYEDDACGGTDCNDSSAAINPGAAEVCGDSLDNNCDGQIDEGCGSTCLASGQSCSTGGDCCSGNCKGKRGRKTCR
ncbi:MAG TPA: MopE-related protein [Myxococcota bacterium]|nr:MopE-related protein [Myxococcota bacterium]